MLWSCGVEWGFGMKNKISFFNMNVWMTSALKKMYYYIFSHFDTTIKSHKILKNYYTPLLFVVASSKKAYAEISISVIYSIICMSIDIE